MGRQRVANEEPESMRIAFRHPLDQLGWTIVYHYVVLDQRISDGTLRLYLLLHRYAQQHSETWVSVERLAADLGVDAKTIQRRLKTLRELGLIDRQREGFGATFTTYILDPRDRYYDSIVDKNVHYESAIVDKNVHYDSIVDKNVPSYWTNLSPHEEIIHDDNDDDDDKRRSESEIVRIEQIIRAVWEGTTGRPVTPDEWQVLESLIADHQVPSTRLLALIPNLALRVGPQAMTVDLLKAAALGDLAVPGLGLDAPAPVSPTMPPTPERQDSDPVLAEVVAMYEAEIGIMSPLIAEELRALTAEIRDLGRWREAFRSAVAANVRRWSYVKACLQSDGRRPPTAAARQSSGPGKARSVRARVVTPEEMPPMPDEEPLPPID